MTEVKKPFPLFDPDNVFCYHAPKDNQPERYVMIREKAKELAKLIQVSTPMSAEQTLSLRDLQRCVMMANAAIAINEAQNV